jgi:hypothetical protein
MVGVIALPESVIVRIIKVSLFRLLLFVCKYVFLFLFLLVLTL